jgi:hypothetical protein
LFFQGDYLYTQTLNKNEFVTRTYDNGTVINKQTCAEFKLAYKEFPTVYQAVRSHMLHLKHAGQAA